jgi:hypothetical protein
LIPRSRLVFTNRFWVRLFGSVSHHSWHSHGQSAPYCLLFRPESPYATEHWIWQSRPLPFKRQDWVAPGGRISSYRWRHKCIGDASSGSITLHSVAAFHRNQHLKRDVLVNGDMKRHRPADSSPSSPPNAIDSPELTPIDTLDEPGRELAIPFKVGRLSAAVLLGGCISNHVLTTFHHHLTTFLPVDFRFRRLLVAKDSRR